ncbi:hypothetical protein ARALYDRAFT_338391 [Arabidopsis lyrata subsp. lyrata]|uniref:Uncharacterized protein n=1 Tax=Arabidopsis lyrata subsp. lyrata TaxID=81972 RepID=D7KXQ6_ARALL|nr:hypothetical protein ARALYDRAFT_338391 [Arabidopsis lyrata subsp. lyrata]
MRSDISRFYAHLMCKPNEFEREDHPYITRTEKDEPQYTIEQELYMMEEQIEESEGFDIDFTLFRCLFNYYPVDLNANRFVEEQKPLGIYLVGCLRNHLTATMKWSVQSMNLSRLSKPICPNPIKMVRLGLVVLPSTLHMLRFLSMTSSLVLAWEGCQIPRDRSYMSDP